MYQISTLPFSAPVFLCSLHLLLISLSTYAWKHYTDREGRVRFQHVLEDAPTGHLYFIDQWNAIHRFQSDLTPVPVDPAQTALIVSRVETPAKEQVFLRLSNGIRILACSVGSCGIVSIGESGARFNWRVLDPTVPANVFSQNDVPVLATAYATTKDKASVYTSSEATFSDAPVLSFRELVVDKISTETSFQFTNHKPYDAPPIFGNIGVHASLRAKHHVKPILLRVLSKPDPVARHNYGYLLTVQNSSVTGKFVTRLGRFCAGDPTLRSYVEITLQCWHGFRYAIATGAAIDESSFGGSLAVTFGREVLNTWEVMQPVRDHSAHSALCVFNLTDVNAHFDKEIEECYLNRDGSRKKLTWITGTDHEQACQNNRSFVSYACTDSWKSTRNGFIAGKEILSAQAVDWSDKPMQGLQLVSSPLKSNGRTTESLTAAYFADSHIYLKDQLERLPGPPRVLSHSTLDSISVAEELRTAVTSNGNEYIIMHENQIEAFSIGCGMYSECGSCYKNSDMDCGWCKNEIIELGYVCASQAECDARHGLMAPNGTCPPEIRDVSPKNGSTAGNATLQIVGNYFGHPSLTRVQVKIGAKNMWSSCIVKEHNYTHITCVTEQGQENRHGDDVEVTVDESWQPETKFRCSGDIRTTDHAFHYLVPEVTSISPTFGPLFGGTLVTLEGHKLNIGSRRRVRVADKVDCEVVAVNETHLSCLMPVHEEKTNWDVVMELLIDDRPMGKINTQFEYRANPKLLGIDPATPVISGGTKIRFIGENFLSLPHPPRILVPYETYYHNFSSCDILTDTVVDCLAPAISSFFPSQPESVQLTARLILDGCDLTSELTAHCQQASGPLTYYRDPVFTEISVEETMPSKQWTATIKDFDSALNVSGLFVQIGGQKCSDPWQEENTVKCLIDYSKDLLDPRTVLIQYGNVQANLPDIIFRGPGTISSTQTVPIERTVWWVWWVISALSGLAVVVFVGLCVYDYFARKNSWIRKVFGCHTPNDPHDPHGNVTPVLPEEIVLLGPSTQATPGSVLSETQFQAGSSRNRVSNPIYDAGNQLQSTSHLNNLQSNTQPDILQSTSHLDSLHENVRRLIHELQLENNIIAPDRLTTGGVRIGSGNGGIVHQETLRVSLNRNRFGRIDVAVKSLRDIGLRSNSEIRKFLEECAVMLKLQHENVMRLEGLCLSNDAGPKLVLPFMPNGDLHKYIQSRPPLPVYTVLDFGIQIAKGMRYLSSELPGQTIVHRDLAARNCMLDENDRVVIADFGLSRDVHSSRDLTYISSHSQEMAFRWLAPECFADSEYSVKSDVWSFGVVIWELCKQGQLPYDSTIGRPRNLLPTLARYIQRGGRLPKPAACSEELYNLVETCWSSNAAARPDFEELVTKLVYIRQSQPFDGEGYLIVPEDV